MPQAPRIVVVGVGNAFRHDDGVGWAVVARLAERAARRPLPPGTVLETSDGEPAGLLGLWEHAELAVVVDAAVAEPASPGRVHRVALDAARRPPSPGAASSHGPGLGDAVELSRALDRLPGRLVVFAVEGTDHTQGPGLTRPVAAQVDAVARDVEAEIRRWHAATASDGQDGTGDTGGRGDGGGEAG
ncbi:hydrogenase maturation protease [Streptomyces tropicalis]|uniref:Hydrogenase maturation protease n=1 Tax=Streptomyces tropicalis TaxID=3034234 RepID=A0ABT6A395_9ACTN|nr:hydrogenase maturation protease [Streptomyces tropicalis]MDF3299130.1 hydrogenase maturation protease [Streptomyces tropicalis]